MRRVLAVGALIVLILAGAGCSGSSAPTPTVPSVDFSPSASIEISDTDPLVVAFEGGASNLETGSVLLVTNTGDADHRLVGTVDSAQVFDTGTLQPGDDTTVVAGADGELHIADITTDREVTITVNPRTPS